MLANLGQGASEACVSPFEAALTRQPRLSTSGLVSTSPGTLVSPFDSATSFPEFLSSASFPDKQGCEDQHSVAAPVSPLESALLHFDLDRRISSQLDQLSHSQPPSPKTPKQGVEAGDGMTHVEVRRIGSEAARSRNPIRGHPRYPLQTSTATTALYREECPPKFQPLAGHAIILCCSKTHCINFQATTSGGPPRSMLLCTICNHQTCASYI